MEIFNSFQPDADFVLYPGDVSDFFPQIPDETVKLVVTSPPYNIGKPYETKLDLDSYYSQQRLIIRECARILQPEGSICWQVGNFVNNGEIIPLDMLLYPIFSELKLHLRNRIVWHFEHGLHASKRFSGRYEVVLWFTKTSQYTFNLDAVRIPQKYPNKKYYKGPNKGELSGNPLGKNPGDIWDIPNVKSNHVEKTEHPCQFPVELIERLVLSMTNAGDWVFDPFMGSGSTAIAALIHDRKVMGAEIVPEYNEITKNRVNLALDGKLRIRPMDRPVYDPNEKSTPYIPPRYVSIEKSGDAIIQKRLLETPSDFNAEEGEA